VADFPTRRTSSQLDREDLPDLGAAIARNAGKPGTPWEIVKKELSLK
jgi:hypothetical protein